MGSKGGSAAERLVKRSELRGEFSRETALVSRGCRSKLTNDEPQRDYNERLNPDVSPSGIDIWELNRGMFVERRPISRFLPGRIALGYSRITIEGEKERE